MEVLTTEQMQKRLDEIMATKNECDKYERKSALIELRCRCQQSIYYNAGDIVNYINEELKLIDELDKLTSEAPKETFLPKAKARMKVIASTCMAVFRCAGVSFANIDTITAARLISFLSGYSVTNIRNYINNETSFLPNDMEAVKAQALLMAMGISEKIVM